METQVNEGEPIDTALRRFRRQCQKEGVLAEVKKREYYDKPSVRRKKKAIAARRRRRR
ncbi:30S ribosomal protein S21 [bacterium]|nr:30S ribosomal protein S21 [bacterium]